MITKRKVALKYTFLSLFLFTNALTIFEASLPGGVSSIRSNIVAFFVGGIINKTTPPVPFVEVGVEELKLSDHKDNEIIENATFEIPLGITRRIKSVILPSNSSDKNITWTSSDINSVRVTSGGYIEARALAVNTKITAVSSNLDVGVSFYVNVIEKKAPLNFELALLESESPFYVAMTKMVTPVLSKEDAREYDVKKITFTSSDESVARFVSSPETIAAGINFGVLKGVGPGTATISAVGSTNSFIVTVETPLIPIIKPTSLTLTGPAFGYVYGYTPLISTFNSNDISDKSISYFSSNEAIATIDKNGVIYGSKVNGSVIITAYANMDFSVKDTLEIQINNVLPTAISLESVEQSLLVSEKMSIIVKLEHDLIDKTIPVTNREVNFTSSDSSIASVTAADGKGVLLAKKRGTVVITAQSVADPNLTTTTQVKVNPRPVIGTDEEFSTLAGFTRKIVGHFFLFFVSSVFGFFTFFHFRKNKLLSNTLYSLGIGLFVAALSEVIQYFVPGRSFAVLDIVIDFAGYLTAALILFLVYHFKQKKKDQKLLDK